MTNQGLWRCLFAGIFFGSYPFIIGVSGLKWLPASIILSIASLAVFAVILLLNPPLAGVTDTAFLLRAETLKGEASASSAILMGIALVTVAGFMNGGGHAFFQPLLAAPIENQISRIGVIVPIVCVLLAIPLGRIFNHEAITADKVIAVVLAVGSILAASGKWRSLLQ